MSEQSPKRAPRAKRAPKSQAVAPEAAVPPSVEVASKSGGAEVSKKRTVAKAKAKVNGVSAPEVAASVAGASKTTTPKAAAPKSAARKQVAASASAKPAPKKAASKAPAKAAVVTAKAPAAPKAADEVVVAAAATPVAAETAQAAVPSLQAPSLSVLLVASEAAPFARTGELADLVGGAATALGALGHRVTLVLPKYAGISVPNLGTPVDRFSVELGATAEEATCYEVAVGGHVRAILVEHPGFFGREFLYGDGHDDYGDNPRRFAFLSKAALEFAAREGERVDVVQAFDWQTGLVPVYLGVDYRRHPALAESLSVFTIHNIAFQGLCSPDWLVRLGLDHGLYSPAALEYWGRVSLLKGGVNFADLVSTLEAEYQETLLTPGHGAGFEGVLASRGEAFRAVLNGDAGATRDDAAYLAQRLSRFYAKGLAARSAASGSAQ